MKRRIVVIGLNYLGTEFDYAIKTINSVELKFFGEDIGSYEKIEANIQYIKENATCIIIGNKSMNDKLNSFYERLKDEIEDIPIIPIDTDLIDKGTFNIDIEKVMKINEYYANGGKQNITSLVAYIAYNFLNPSDSEKLELKKHISELELVPFNGIFHGETNEIFNSFQSYAKWYLAEGNVEEYKWIGIRTFRANWLNDNTAIEKELISELESLGLKVIPVFSYSSAENNEMIKSIDGIINDYFSLNGKLVIDALIDFQILPPVSNDKNINAFEQSIKRFKDMNIPVFKPLISYSLNIDTWDVSMDGTTSEMGSNFTSPERIGMIEPIIIGCKDKFRKNVPIKDRVKKFSKRVKKWTDLRHTKNKDKKIALFIHNAPCSGVEATIGKSAGLEVFESIIQILKKLKDNGYEVGDIPKTGQELHRMIMDKKAYSDFRWTSAEDIINAGGCIYKMDLEENNGYMKFYNELDQSVQNEMEETWGPPPGEGMVHKGKIIISGIRFGNINIMVQPKRGCYGAKCTGEVCKILHNPKCPPPHQYLATYRYVDEIFNANAIIHVGTGGNIEFLPGKKNALSSKCYPDIAIGNTPHFYIYNAGIGGEGVLPKRRTSAVIVDYLPAAMKSDVRYLEIINLANEYIEAKLTNSRQLAILKKELDNKLKMIEGAEKVVATGGSFYEGIEKLKNYMVQTINNSKSEELHVFGEIPENNEMISIIKEYIDSNSLNASLIQEVYDDYSYNNLMLSLINNIINPEGELDLRTYDIEKEILKELSYEMLEIYEKLLLVNSEIDNLIQALDCKYVEPGLAGMPNDNFKKVIPTGRNFYLMDSEKIPTKAAYQVGRALGDGLIERYKEDEGRYPYKVAMNMISTDISGAKGEQLSQILYLMGVSPIWDKNGKVLGLEIIPLETLNRPRIDVTIRISGVLRDAYPEVIKLIDDAICMVGGLDESIQENYIKKNTLEMKDALKESGVKEQDIERRSTIRIFGNKPGAYGSGVDLALKASAWKDEKDIAKTFLYFSSYAYGKGLSGDMAKTEFVENINASDLSYQNTHSNRYNIMSSTFSASIHGGMAVVKKLLTGKEMKQYHGSSINKNKTKISTIKEEIKENIEDTFLNPLWKESTKEKGYIGASEFMSKVQSIFDWQCLSENIDHKDLDMIVEQYINDEEMQDWFSEINKYAFEEISRRFLELYQRGKWKADKDILDELKRNYIRIEGDMEELSQDSCGEIQGGEIEVLNQDDIDKWRENLKEFDEILLKESSL